MNALAKQALVTLALTERGHARRWMARISTHKNVKGETGVSYAWRQARRHLAKSANAMAALALL